MSDRLDTLQQRLGYTFREPQLLLAALTHPSYVAEVDCEVGDNQRLEFLGDAVIQILLTQRIYTRYPHWSEGEMTRFRAILTRQPTLAAIASHLQLGEYLRIGRGERLTQGDQRPSNLCDAFEALIAAIYLDTGQRLDLAGDLLDRLIDTLYPDAEDLLARDNPKGILQELCQRLRGTKPDYQTLDITGPDHQRQFTVAVHIGDTPYGTGVGTKRQQAEQDAARHALARLQHEQAEAAESP